MADLNTTSASEPSTKEIILDQIVSIVGEHALDTVSPDIEPPTIPAPAPSSDDDDFVPCCITQKPIPTALQKNKNLGAIWVGLQNECPRWVPGSVLKYVVVKEGFKTPADADFAALHLQKACEKWNELDVGVTFEWVTNMADATFALWHGGNQGGTLASAFFPNPNDMSVMMVYNLAFAKPKWKEAMWKVFMHELGHVLGLRHEFAMDIDSTTGNSKETINAVQLGPRNPKSVMTYSSQPPEVQDTDVESVRAFYALRAAENGDSPMIGLTPVEDYYPM